MSLYPRDIGGIVFIVGLTIAAIVGVGIAIWNLALAIFAAFGWA